MRSVVFVQGLGGLVEAAQGLVRILGLGVEVEHVLHLAHEAVAGRTGHAPGLLPLGLPRVF